MRPIALAFSVVSALSVAACTTSPQVSASKDRLNSSTRQIVGTSLIGAKGKTPADQDKIDDTAAGLCGAGVWTRSECARHGQEIRQ